MLSDDTNVNLTVLNLVVFVFLNCAICAFFWKKSTERIAYLKFLFFTLNVRDRSPYNDSASIKTARIFCVATSVAVMFTFSAFYK